MRFRPLIAAALALGALLTLAGCQRPAQAPTGDERVLRVAFPIAETGFDPAQVSDLYSRTIIVNLFEAPLTYDYLARPVQIRPLTAAAMPEVSDNHTTWTLRIRPGIYFADDPAFKGQRRELTAEDYVYTFKRIYDPALKSPSISQVRTFQPLGLAELRERALQSGQPFDYAAPVAGVQALDRYTLRIRLAAPAPRFVTLLADSAVLGAMAREVALHYGDTIMQHPVGTGPFVLSQWRRSSRMVLTRNPGFREERYDPQPAADDAEGQAIRAQLGGRRLPMLDRVEVSIVEESQPRLLGFLNGEHDMLDRVPPELAPNVLPHGELAPNLAAQGIRKATVAGADVSYFFFNMAHPLVGGYTPEKVALRRAFALAYDGQAEINRVRNGQAVPAESIIPPGVVGYDPALHTGMAEYDVARANALLDTYGYRDADGDGWRDLPNGQPLQLVYASQSDQASRGLQELVNQAAKALRLRLTFSIAKWPEQLKASRAGNLMMWGVAWSATTPDASYMLDLLYGPSAGQNNHARFDLPAYNALFDRQAALPDGPEREALIREMAKLTVAYMPMKLTNHRLLTDLQHPWVVGYRRHPFLRENWRFMSIEK